MKQSNVMMIQLIMKKNVKKQHVKKRRENQLVRSRNRSIRINHTEFGNRRKEKDKRYQKEGKINYAT